ncbi:DNA-methyltransferase [Burkholderia multivorans]|uniref:DNA-methyltransferase n=1 Tax=Burkholderia multivorans TaxID=87883 RepID=UPI00158A0669|nr:site-specific DNA-methyltransferase [Burkholderia multivorans]MDR8877281.1 Modification methylase PvuII [Burkholderia multivorans]MDR8882459.1 Modification methylase PvuII [Burkholderia multivorans]MDR8889480.1 Modification methylase PvuII [Burkholderia multivorans]MDR8908234.1 Modification methylase PvuII [Burkholderia multivorans]MDR8915113.1 Modification methylase PvuII [Burkholderia multivorans]
MSGLHLQLDLFAHVATAYAEASNRELTNAELYPLVVSRAGLDAAVLDDRVPVGRTGERHNLFRRKIRWAQQTLKEMGVLSRVAGRRGVWVLSEAAGKKLSKARAGVKLVAFSTDLGVAIWGNNLDIIDGIDEPISLVFSSLPYLLRKPRAYGGIADEQQYIDFICNSTEPLLKHLAPGGSICLNLTADAYETGVPAQSIYFHRLVCALHDRLGLKMMNDVIWEGSKPPGPTHWACVNHVQLCSAYEHILWLTNDAQRIVDRVDNRRVIEPHTDKHQRFVASGGIQRTATFGDGSHRHRPGGFSRPTAGKLPRNILKRGNRCADTLRYREDAQRLDLPIHGAMMPLSVPDHFIRLLTEPGDLVVDHFGGTIKTGMAAERLQRRWICVELMLEYVRAAAERFRECAGFHLHPAMEAVGRRMAVAKG